MSSLPILSLAAAAIAAAALPAQSWSPHTESLALSGRPVAHDAHRDRTVAMDTAGQTWEHDGQRWQRTAVGFPGQPPAAFAYQEHRGKVLAFGQGTHEYDGSRWVARTTDHTPPARTLTSLAYDSSRSRVVMFGGLGGDFRGDTWEFDGQDWIRRLPLHQPSPRSDAAMAFDRQRGVTVLFGGRNALGELSDHFEWNGSDWLARQPAGLPSARSGAQLAYDDGRQRLVLLGGYGLVNGLPSFDPQPHEFDGVQWTRRNLATAPTARLFHAMVAVAGGVRVLGGVNTFQDDQRHDVFDYDGVAFTQRAGRYVTSGAAAFDELRQRTVLLGYHPAGMATYEWDGGRLQRLPVPGPTSRTDHAMCSGLGGGVFAFGGRQGAAQTYGDSWAFDGTQWLQVATSGPSPRSLPAMTKDAFRNRIVLFGGLSATLQDLGDTWEFDGVNWTPHAATGPQARYRAAMAAYPGQALVVMHGGFAANPLSAETWGFDGTAWTALDSSLDAGAEAAMAFVPNRSLMVMTRKHFQGAAETYGYTPFVGWSAMGPGPSGQPAQRLAIDPLGDAIEISGVDGLSVSLLTQSPATVQPYSPGCSNANVPPRLLSHTAPVPGAGLALELFGTEPQQLALIGWTVAPTYSYYGNCQSQVTATELLALGVSDTFGYLRIPFGLPQSNALLGLVLACQAASVEIAGPVLGSLALSDGLWLQIGR